MAQQTNTTKVVRVELDDSIRIIALNNMGSFFQVGDACHPGYGGGEIASLELDRQKGALIIRKTTTFFDPAQQRLGKFDAIAVPFARVKYAYIKDEAAAPAAKPE